MSGSSPSVLFLVDRWDAGGVRKHIEDLCRAFGSRGMDCAVAGWLPPDGQPPTETEFFYLPLYRENGNKSLSGFSKSVAQLRALLKSRRFDILHMHSRYVTPLATAATAGLTVARVYTAHNTFRNLRFLPWYPRTVICLTEAGKTDFQRNHFLPRNSIAVVIPHGIEIHADTPASVRETKQSSFVYIGRLEKQKGVDLLLRAVADLRDTNIHVTIAGSGSEEGALRILSQKLGLGSRVEFSGYVDCSDEILDASAALILPSTKLEGFGYVILEAFARHRAVIASDMAVFDETVREAVTGIRFETGNHESLAAALRRAMTETDKMKAMGENGFQLLREQFTLQRMADATLKVYESSPGTGRPML